MRGNNVLLFFFIILLFVIIFAREIKFIIGVLLLYAICLALWDFWWGKIIVVGFFILMVLGIVGTIMEKYEKSSFAKHKKVKNKIADERLREKAYLYGVEYWTKKDGEDAARAIDNYRSWKIDPTSHPDIEKWYQENKATF